MCHYKIGLAAIVLVFVLTAGSTAQPKSPTNAASGKHDVLVEAQLRVMFGRADLDSDGFLDAAELARAFRGAKAKPAPQPKYDDKGNLVKSSGAKYPDQIYLLALDQDGDGKISWAEFDTYGEAYAAQLKNMQQMNQQAFRTAYAQAQRHLAAQRNVNYSRYGRSNYHRPAYSHRGPRQPHRR